MISPHASKRPRLRRVVCTAALFALVILPGCDALTDPGAAGGLAGLFAPPPDAATDPAADAPGGDRRLDDAADAAREPGTYGADPNPNCTISIEEVGTWANMIGSFRRPGPGNTKQFRATVMPANSMVKIRFSLVQTSREKGTTLNAGNTTDPDLTFENQAGYVNPTGDKQQITEDNANDNTGTFAGAWVVIDAEQMKLTALNTTNNTITVTRGQNGTTAAAHANGATVSLPPSFYNVTRGQYGTTAAAHAAGVTTLAPRCFYNCTRGAAGTTAAAHAANRIVPYFYSPEQTNAAIASTLAHEASHTLIPGDGHLGDDAMFIMKSNQKPGAWDEHGVYHTHSKVSLNVMRFRLP